MLSIENISKRFEAIPKNFSSIQTCFSQLFFTIIIHKALDQANSSFMRILEKLFTRKLRGYNHFIAPAQN